jgi:hypothetical protein
MRPTFLLLSTAFLLFAVAASGCSGANQETAPEGSSQANAANQTAAVPAKQRQIFEGVSLEFPGSWKWMLEDQEGKKSFVAGNPELEGGFQTYLEISKKPVPESVTLAGQLDFLEGRFRDKSKDFAVQRKETLTHRNGFEYGVLEYSQLFEEENVPLKEMMVVILQPDKTAMTVALTTAASHWAKNQPIFAEIVESLQLASPKP